ncbi:hypothetical protein [Streptomyces sp. NPDC012510]|uniref:hypothetical protein n=1 Tax=Streptomyces sp. NPDC012510 TaxID=3364838 RepID=UPI0036F09BAF
MMSRPRSSRPRPTPAHIPTHLAHTAFGVLAAVGWLLLPTVTGAGVSGHVTGAGERVAGVDGERSARAAAGGQVVGAAAGERFVGAAEGGQGAGPGGTELFMGTALGGRGGERGAVGRPVETVGGGESAAPGASAQPMGAALSGQGLEAGLSGQRVEAGVDGRFTDAAVGDRRRPGSADRDRPAPRTTGGQPVHPASGERPAEPADAHQPASATTDKPRARPASGEQAAVSVVPDRSARPTTGRQPSHPGHEHLSGPAAADQPGVPVTAGRHGVARGSVAAANGESSGVDLILPVAAAGAAIAVATYSYVRRKRRAAARTTPTGTFEPPVASLPDLRRRAERLLVETDDSVRTSAEELGFATAVWAGRAAGVPDAEGPTSHGDTETSAESPGHHGHTAPSSASPARGSASGPEAGTHEETSTEPDSTGPDAAGPDAAGPAGHEAIEPREEGTSPAHSNQPDAEASSAAHPNRPTPDKPAAARSDKPGAEVPAAATRSNEADAMKAAGVLWGRSRGGTGALDPAKAYAETPAARDAVMPFAEALADAGGELAGAFRAAQRLDEEAGALSPDEERALWEEILTRCTTAQRRLDTATPAFDQLRSLERDITPALEYAEARFRELTGRTATATTTLAALRDGYAPAASLSVAGHVEQAKDRLVFATTELNRARQAAYPGDLETAAVHLRAAEGAIHQADVLVTGVERLAAELARAAATTQEGAPSTGSYDDPLDALCRQGRWVLPAHSAVAAATDFVTTHRGAIGVKARTRLAEARRHQAAGPGVDRVPDLMASDAVHAQRALALAREARGLAEEDVRRYENPYGGPVGGGLAGAVLGGIILAEAPGDDGPVHPRGPACYGGTATRARRAVDGHF